MSWLLHRLGQSAAVLLLLSVLTFALADLAPGDPLAEMRLDPRISSEALAALRARYGLDAPLPVRYGQWLASITRGELGFSFARNMPVGALLWPRVWNTLVLTVTATMLAWFLAFIFGAWAALRPRRWVDRAGGLLTSLLLATPQPVLALGGLWAASELRWLPMGGDVSAGTLFGIEGRLRDLALPVVALVLVAVPALWRHVRSAFEEALREPWVEAARAHGLPRHRWLLLYALPAAANPLLSLLGLSIAGLLSGSLVVEVVFDWPGLGPLLLAAISARDLHLVVGAVMLSGALALAGNLLADLLLFRLDPRPRREGP